MLSDMNRYRFLTCRGWVSGMSHESARRHISRHQRSRMQVSLPPRPWAVTCLGRVQCPSDAETIERTGGVSDFRNRSLKREARRTAIFYSQRKKKMGSAPPLEG